jgi:hypothetical protein
MPRAVLSSSGTRYSCFPGAPADQGRHPRCPTLLKVGERLLRAVRPGISDAPHLPGMGRIAGIL